MSNWMKDIYLVEGHANIKKLELLPDEKQTVFESAMDIIVDDIIENDVDGIYEDMDETYVYNDEAGMFLNDSRNLLAIPKDSSLYKTLLNYYNNDTYTLINNVDGGLYEDEDNFYFTVWIYDNGSEEIEEAVVDALVGLENLDIFG